MKYKLCLVLGLLVAVTACGDSDGCTSKKNAKVSTDDFDLGYVLEWIQQHEGDLSDLQKAVNDPSQKFHNVDTNQDNMLDFIRVVEHRKDGYVVVEFVAYPDGNKKEDSIAVASVKVEKKSNNKVALSAQYPEYVDGSEKSYYPPTELKASELDEPEKPLNKEQKVASKSGGIDTTDVLLLMWLMNSTHDPYRAPMGHYYEPHETWSGKGSFRKHARKSRKSTVSSNTTSRVRTVKRIKPKKRPSNVKPSPTAKKTRSRIRTRTRTRSNTRSRTRTPTRSPTRSYRPTRSFGSRRSSIDYKQNVDYLNEQELMELSDELNELNLTTWEYKNEPETRHFGIIVEDVDIDSPLREAVVREDEVDLYGMISLNVASNQHQNKQIRLLLERVERLEQRVKSCNRNQQ